MSKKIFILILGIFLLTTLVGCRPEKKEGEKSSKTSRETLKLPKNFPEDFPIYPKAELKSVKWRLDKRGRLTFTVWWEVTAPQQDAITFYDATLPQKGWTIERKSQSANNVFVYTLKRPSDARDNLSGIRIIQNTKRPERIYIHGEVKLPG